MKALFRFLCELFRKIRTTISSKELRSAMTNSRQLCKLNKQKITRDQFDNSASVPAYEIKRLGKKIYIVDANSSKIITQDSVGDLSRRIKQSNKPVKIVTTGLSKAQVGRIVGSIRNATAKGIYIKKVDSSDNNRVLTYEILATGGIEVNGSSKKKKDLLQNIEVRFMTAVPKIDAPFIWGKKINDLSEPELTESDLQESERIVKEAGIDLDDFIRRGNDVYTIH